MTSVASLNSINSNGDTVLHSCRTLFRSLFGILTLNFIVHIGSLSFVF